MSWLFPSLGSFEWSSYTHPCAEFLCGHKFPPSFGKISKNVTAGSSVKSLVRNHQAVFQNGCTIFLSRQQWVTVPVASHSLWQLALSALWMVAILWMPLKPMAIFHKKMLPLKRIGTSQRLVGKTNGIRHNLQAVVSTSEASDWFLHSGLISSETQVHSLTSVSLRYSDFFFTVRKCI